MNGRTNSSGSSVNDLQIPLDPCTNLECVAGNAQVELTWTDPLNKYATPEGEVAEDPDQLVSVWHHTVVIRKVGSAPVGIDDGIVVVSSEVKNQYQSTAYIDTGLVNDTTYYYGVFAINEDGVESEGLVSEGVTPKLGTPLSELAEGTIIRINENGAPVEFYLAKHNYEPDLNGPGRELLVRKNIHSMGAWNITNRNTYVYSTIHKWLTGEYINVFSSYIRSIISRTKIYYTPGYNNVNVDILETTIFQLSGTEYGFPEDINMNIEGTIIPMSGTLQYGIFNGTNQGQWTRSPHTYIGPFSSRSSGVWYIGVRNQAGSIPIAKDEQLDSDGGYRPAFCISSQAIIDRDNSLVEN